MSATPDHTTPVPATELHICAGCGSPLMQLVDGTQGRPGRWELMLRCPECERVHDVSCDEPALACLEAELYRGIAAVQQELERVSRLAFEEDVERFAAALRAGAILPMDFRAGP